MHLPPPYGKLVEEALLYPAEYIEKIKGVNADTLNAIEENIFDCRPLGFLEISSAQRVEKEGDTPQSVRCCNYSACPVVASDLFREDVN